MANTPINAMTATFGSGDQTAIKMNVSDAGPSNNSSKLIDLQLGSVTKFKVSKRGEVTATNYTGSFSGSNFIKNQSSATGTKYLLFSDGSGQRTIGYDTSLNYDASSNTLNTNGSINAGGDIDSTNVSPLLLSSPTTIGFGNTATTIQIGSPSVGSYTRFNSKQVRGNFTGSFTGSFSGSKGNFTKISGSNGVITGRFTANSFTGSISGSRANFTKISGSNGVITGRFIANSFTGSISGGYAAFTKIVGSTFLVTGGVIANSFTGSVYDVNRSKFSKVYVDSQLTASRASLVTVKIEGGTINSTLIGNTTPATITGSAITAFTKFVGNLTGSVYDVNRSKFSKVYVDSQLTASRAWLVTAKIEGGTINSTLIGNTTPATITGSAITAFTKFVGNLTGSVYDVNRSKFSKVYVDSQLTASRASLVTVKIEGGTINSTLIGNTTPATITGSAITAFTKFVGNLTGSVYDVNRSKFSKVYVDSQLTASRASLVTVKIEGGTINSTLIGNITPATITGSSGRIENDLVIKGSLQLYNAITGSNSMFISGAGTPIAGYVGIMIGGVKYKMPLYPWT